MTETDHRCKPGRLTVDRKCNMHPSHHWCSGCQGYYGVPHDAYSCHTLQAAMRRPPTGSTVPNPGQCACRFCEAAYRRFGVAS